MGIQFGLNNRPAVDNRSRRGEGFMRTSRIRGMWLLAAALLASIEFGYAHLQQLALWPVQLIASSLWRLFGDQASGGTSCAAAWLPPAALLLAGLAAEVLAVRLRREGDGHE